MDKLELIDEIFIEIMEEMTFADVIVSQEAGYDLENSLVVKLDVLMPFVSNALIIEFSKDLAGTLAGNLSSEGGIKGDDAIYDLLSEFLNVLIGKVLDRLYPSESLYELGIPGKASQEDVKSENYVARYFEDPNQQGVTLHVHPGFLILLTE